MRTTFGKYTYNEHKVCINPDVVDIDTTTRIEISQCGENAWVYGYTYDWGGSPCMRDIDVCATKEEAIREALKRLLKNLKHHPNCKASAKLVREKLFETRQLTLF